MTRKAIAIALVLHRVMGGQMKRRRVTGVNVPAVGRSRGQRGDAK
jgi:hypothetical protein